MTRKLLSKNINCFFLDQPLAENLQPINNTLMRPDKRKRLRTGIYKKVNTVNKGKTSNLALKERYNLSVSNNIAAIKKESTKRIFIEDGNLSEGFTQVAADSPVTSSKNQVLWSFSKKDRIEKAEAQIINHFLFEQKSKKDKKLPVGLANATSVFACNTDIYSDMFPYLLQSIEQIRNILVSKKIQSYTYSEFKRQLREIKKICFLYGNLAKRDLKKAVQKAKKLRGVPSNNLLAQLESRLDVVLERGAFFASIQESRQSVAHGRIKINNKVVNIPGYQLKAGDVIQVKPLKEFSSYERNNLSTPSFSHNDIFGNKIAEEKLSTKIQNGRLSSLGWRFAIFPYILRSLIKMQSLTLFSDQTDAANALRYPYILPKRTDRKALNKSFVLAQAKTLLLQQEDIFSIRRLAILTQIFDFLPFCVDATATTSAQQNQKKLSASKYHQLVLSPLTGRLAVRAFKKLYKWFDYSSKFFSFNSFNVKGSRNNRLINQSGKLLSVEACAGALLNIELLVRFYSHRGAVCLSSLSNKIRRFPIGITKNNYMSENVFSNYFGTKFSTFYKYKSFLFLFYVKRFLIYLRLSALTNIKSTSLWDKNKGFKPNALSRKANLFVNVLSSNNGESLSRKRSKPLHIEISYKGLFIIFLYAPQRVYLPAIIDLDLVTKRI